MYTCTTVYLSLHHNIVGYNNNHQNASSWVSAALDEARKKNAQTPPPHNGSHVYWTVHHLDS